MYLYFTHHKNFKVDQLDISYFKNNFSGVIFRTSSPRPDSVINKINVATGDVRNSPSVASNTPPEQLQSEVCGGHEMPRGHASSPEDPAALRKG